MPPQRWRRQWQMRMRAASDAEEIVISAFCGANTTPVLDGERNVQCAGPSSNARPSVLICGKK
jgi:hypothetical protein